MKQKLFTLFLALVASVSAIYAQSGTCGNNLTWNLNAETGVLTISGTGAMSDYNSYSPWYDYRYSIKSVIINDGVTSIGNYAFYGCSSLTSINVDANNANYCSIDGVFFNKDKTTLIQYPSGNTRSEYIIPNSVTSIGKYAFNNCKSLTSVTIGNSMTSIGDYAFDGCSSLTSVTINSDSIVNKAYTSSDNLSDIFGSQVTQYIIGDNVKGIGDGAFDGCYGLTSITIPNSVTSIGKSAFWHCNSLTSITIPNSVTSIGEYAFQDCSSLTSVTIGNSVTSIGESAFEACSSLTSITIPNSVTSIGESAFGYCSSLTSVTIGNSVASIGQCAFDWCTSLTSITIPNSVTSIGDNAFYGTGIYANEDNWENDVLYINNCLIDAKTSISGAYAIKEGTRVIADYAFYKCSSLTSITIPNSMISIGEPAFVGCDNITSITWNAKNCADFSRPLYASSTQITSFDFGDNVKHIPAYLCYGMNKLTSITIPNSVTSIGSRAFWGCSSLTSITIPNSVTSIGNYAFYDCSALTSVTIPNSVTSIGESAFGSCSSLTSVTWNAKNCADFSSSSYPPFYGIRTQITSFAFGDNVEHIPAYLCYGMNKLTSITIPNSVTSIGEWAFKGTGIYANEDNWENDVLYINDCLISAKESISGAYTIKAGTRIIAGGAFRGCSSLTSINIPNSVTSIGRMAFAYDDALVAINVKQGNRAYSSVDGVLYNRDKTVIIAYPTGKTNNSYTILDGVNTIDSCAFIGNKYLEYINMPKTLICIDYGAFGNCTKLIKIVIPKTVRSIGYRAFYNCASLKKIYNNAIIPQEIDDQTFEKVDVLNCELYVMPMAFINYYNANIWKDFGLIETIEIGGIDIDDSKLEFTTTQKQANVLWAANTKATLYLLSMRRVGSEDTYTFTFDENGYLISSDTNSLDFSKLIYLQNAAYSLTITDFDTDATYVYSFLYKDNEGNILHSESGQFSPGEFPEGIENVQSNEVQSTKVIKDGQVLILRNGKTYTMQGQEVK